MQQAGAYEFVRLALGALVLPFVVSFYLKLRNRPGTASAFVAVSAIYFSYVCTVIETWVLPGLLNTLQHVSYGIAGVAIAIAAWTLRSQSVRRRRT